MNNHTGRIASVDALRGLASLSVAWFHFTNANPALAPGMLKASGAYGWLGVYIFFVISGFVIPYSLDKANYHPKQFGRFLTKRIARLDPPYLANMGFILLLAFIVPLVPGFRGPKPHFEALQLVAHVGYLNSVVGKQWINPVYWSLGIEFQYYLLIGLIFPLVSSGRATVRNTVLAVLVLPGLFLRQVSLIPVHLPLFVLGILTYQYKTGRLSKNFFLLGIALVSGLVGIRLGGAIGITCGVTALVIAFGRFAAKPLTWLGTISYSLYLMHVPVGGKIIDIGVRFRHGVLVPSFFLIAATAGSIFAAWILYRCVELPSQTWASRISYRSKKVEEGQRSEACVAAA